MADKRTLQQNKSLHLYFEFVAQTLNDAGLDMRAVLKPNVEIPWNKDTVKEHLWRPIQKLQLQKKSTTELEKRDIDKVYETMNRHLGYHGVHIPFPSLEGWIEAQK